MGCVNVVDKSRRNEATRIRQTYGTVYGQRKKESVLSQDDVNMAGASIGICACELQHIRVVDALDRSH